MKHVMYLMLMAAFIGCTKEESDLARQETTELTGKWVRVEEYINPGNGGFWRTANDNPPVVLELTEDGRVVSNHHVYSQFNYFQKVSEDTISFRGISAPSRNHSYSLDKGVLTIRYLCIEGCGDRFVKRDQE